MELSLQDAAREALEAARRAHETASQALEAASKSSQFWPILFGAVLALGGSFAMWYIQRKIQKKEEKRQLEALIYCYAHEAVELCTGMAGLCQLVSTGGTPHASEYDRLPPGEVSRLVTFECPQSTLDAVFDLRERTASISSLMRRIDEGFARDAPGPQPVSYGWGATHDLIGSLAANHDRTIEIARVLLRTVATGLHRVRGESLRLTLDESIPVFRAAYLEYMERFALALAQRAEARQEDREE